MTNRRSKNFVLFVLIILYIFLYRFFIYNNFLQYSGSITASFSLILLSLSVYFFGFRKSNNSELKTKFLRLIIIFLIIYFIGTYGLGLFLGFLTNSYSLKLKSIIDNTFSVIIVICAIELFRYVFISSDKNSKIEISFMTFLLILFEINLLIRYDSFTSLSGIFKFTSITILPICIKNIMCSYLTYYSDYKPSLIYRLVMELYFYIVPIQPDLSDYLISIITLLLPFMVTMYSSRIVYNHQRIKEHEFGKKIIKLSDIPFLALVTSFACIVLGIGPFKLIGIETGSMTPSIKIGDAVVIDKNYDRDKLQEGDIIAYLSNDGIIVVHRIIKVNSDETFVTKGDYNNVADSGYVQKSQVQGKVRFKIPFIAYPAIMFK